MAGARATTPCITGLAAITWALVAGSAAFVALGCGGAAEPADAPAAALTTAVDLPGAPQVVASGPADAPEPPDPSLVPPGRGWHCFGQSVSLRCFRQAADCTRRLEQTRLEDQEDGEATVTTDGCLALEAAWCMTYERTDGVKRFSCFTNETTCLEDGNVFRSEAARLAEGEEVPEGMVVTRRASGCALVR
jgi:hypothetical protein